MSAQPKKYIKHINFLKQSYGTQKRVESELDTFKNTTGFPEPLEYDDIDEAFLHFIQQDVHMVDDKGEVIPTYTLFSGQRFSEYTQTWQHTDKDGNLLMNFKTIGRENNPSFGTSQGGKYNIPGRRKIASSISLVLDENGCEYYDLHTMEQPFSVDLVYRVMFVTSKYEKINEFNSIINRLFQSRQFYIFPNGHAIPLVIDNINDDTEYSVDNRKFFEQTITIKALAYIIEKSSFETKRIPKLVYGISDDRKRLSSVTIEDFISEDGNNPITEMNMEFGKNKTLLMFTADSDMSVYEIEKENIRSMKMFVNDDEISCSDGKVLLKDGDEVKLKIIKVDSQLKSSVKFTALSL